MFTKCTSLLYLPDLSKWKGNNLKKMKSLFIDCLSLISLPNISKWIYYNENDLNKTPEYLEINRYIELKFELLTTESGENYNNIHNSEYMAKLRFDKYEKIYKNK